MAVLEDGKFRCSLHVISPLYVDRVYTTIGFFNSRYSYISLWHGMEYLFTEKKINYFYG